MLVVAGCGSSGTSGQLSRSAYEHELQSIGADVNAAISGASPRTSRNPRDIADQLESLRKRLDRAADDVDDLSPPDDAQNANDQLARALDDFDDGFASLEDAIRKTDAAGARDATKDLQEAATSAQVAVKALEAKGYDLGELGTD